MTSTHSSFLSYPNQASGRSTPNGPPARWPPTSSTPSLRSTRVGTCGVRACVSVLGVYVSKACLTLRGICAQRQARAGLTLEVINTGASLGKAIPLPRPLVSHALSTTLTRRGARPVVPGEEAGHRGVLPHQGLQARRAGERALPLHLRAAFIMHSCSDIAFALRGANSHIHRKSPSSTHDTTIPSYKQTARGGAAAAVHVLQRVPGRSRRKSCV